MNTQDQLKKAVGEKAASLVKDGMKVGIGFGSTVYWFVRALGERVKQEGLEIEGIPSSIMTGEWAKEFGVPLTDFETTKELDITIDGSDEVDPDFQLIKGGGAALFREKIIAQAAKKLIIIVDESKMVDHLGAFALPVEILPFAWERTAYEIEKLGCTPVLRLKDGETLITDNGNYIVDCPFEKIKDPAGLDRKLQSIVGVVETGLFIDMADTVIIGGSEGISIKEK
ncbi:ribose-5-phosphate isomerase RpiA [Oceanobacillus neutriphilus]|uniref:Ribose-5-phosphate isomerase A n=1 Tax=Oceanobacillus neutriphilus TaxID=531815 RepID=A0ABQ2NME6_9BACI|nr:ribose-5-phosphate isomerase RpiA [Oceanobacillus neutriphilus]GGP07089.1 ribose-5-phosphate isomerase A [Oceanobacillus neutriphilus]